MIASALLQFGDDTGAKDPAAAEPGTARAGESTSESGRNGLGQLGPAMAALGSKLGTQQGAKLFHIFFVACDAVRVEHHGSLSIWKSLFKFKTWKQKLELIAALNSQGAGNLAELP